MSKPSVQNMINIVKFTFIVLGLSNMTPQRKNVHESITKHHLTVLLRLRALPPHHCSTTFEKAGYPLFKLRQKRDLSDKSAIYSHEFTLTNFHFCCLHFLSAILAPTNEANFMSNVCSKFTKFKFEIAFRNCMICNTKTWQKNKVILREKALNSPESFHSLDTSNLPSKYFRLKKTVTSF